MPNSKFEFCNCTSLIVTFQKIISTFTEKNWKLSFVKFIHKRTNVCGSGTKCKTGSGRPKTARTVDACTELRMLFVVCDAFNVLSCSHCFQLTTTSFELR